MKTKKQTKDRIKKILADNEKIIQAMNRAVQEAIQKHKAAGNRIAVWINPEKI